MSDLKHLRGIPSWGAACIALDSLELAEKNLSRSLESLRASGDWAGAEELTRLRAGVSYWEAELRRVLDRVEAEAAQPLEEK